VQLRDHVALPRGRSTRSSRPGTDQRARRQRDLEEPVAEGHIADVATQPQGATGLTGFRSVNAALRGVRSFRRGDARSAETPTDSTFAWRRAVKTNLLSQIAPDNRLLRRLSIATKTATEAFVAVSFATKAGAATLVQVLSPMVKRGASVKVYLSGYMNITHPKALSDLHSLALHYPDQLHVYFDPDSTFHCKFMLLRLPDKKFEAFVGSSNLSVSAFHDEGELNVQVSGSTTDAFYKSAQFARQHIENDFAFEPLKPDAIEEYRIRRQKGPASTPSKKSKSRDKNGTKPGASNSGFHLTVQKVPIYVAARLFSTKERNAITSKRPEWHRFFGWISAFNHIKPGQDVLEIDKTTSPYRFAVHRVIGHDSVAGAGHILGVQARRLRKLSVLSQ
jgi:HKD family nuclease